MYSVMMPVVGTNSPTWLEDHWVNQRFPLLSDVMSRAGPAEVVVY